MLIYASLEGSREAIDHTAKKLKKVLKNLLTNGKTCGMIAKLSPLRGVARRTLKTEQQRVQSKRLYTYVSQDIYGTR